MIGMRYNASKSFVHVYQEDGAIQPLLAPAKTANAATCCVTSATSLIATTATATLTFAAKHNVRMKCGEMKVTVRRICSHVMIGLSHLLHDYLIVDKKD